MAKNNVIKSFDERRELALPGKADETIRFCAQHFIDVVKNGQQARGVAAVALSGGSTPKAIFTLLALPEYAKQVDWKNVLLFWSDERSVPPDHVDSNYKMAMDAGLGKLNLPKENVFRMPADEKNLQLAAAKYEAAIVQHVPEATFDLIMLGMGDDGHTASLFPKTAGLQAVKEKVIANYIPQKETWRLSFTYECIHAAFNTAIYVLGATKAEMVVRVLKGPYEPELLPIQRVGTPMHKALWILDDGAASLL